MPAIRLARPAELVLLPAVELAADTRFSELGVGPLPEPGSAAELSRALAVLVAGDPPFGFARLEEVGGEAHLEQLAVHPDHGRRGIGRGLLEAACTWASDAGYGEISLVTYRDVPWNGPFYARAGFEGCGPADEWLRQRARPNEAPVMARFGTRVVMTRSLRTSR